MESEYIFFLGCLAQTLPRGEQREKVEASGSSFSYLVQAGTAEKFT